jgi:hypothetical protein
MSYITKLIYFSIIVLYAAPVLAQDTRYRVELLVLTHLNHTEEAAESDVISDYSTAIDFLTPLEEAEEESETESAGPQEIDPGDSATAELESAENDEQPEPDPNALLHMEEMSEVMRESWRRLRLSAPFRPQQYLSWEQGNQEPFPVLRIHDLEVTLSKDPHAAERLELIAADLLESESEQQELLLAEQRLNDPGAEEAFDDPSTETEMPGLTHYYRLDGAVTLRRSRFLHLDLDIQLRQGDWEPEPLQIIAQDPVIYERAGPTVFFVHELKQSRQVKSARMEYFDGPVLSVLAYITSTRVAEGKVP